jgi:hypothetical protein
VDSHARLGSESDHRIQIASCIASSEPVARHAVLRLAVNYNNRKLNVVFLPFLTMGPKPATVACLYSETGLSRPAAAAALAIPDRAALIFSAYCNGILGDFHPPA